MRHLLSAGDLSRDEALLVLDTAAESTRPGAPVVRHRAGRLLPLPAHSLLVLRANR